MWIDPPWTTEFPCESHGGMAPQRRPVWAQLTVGQVANWSVSDDHLFPTNRSEQMINKVRVEHQAFLVSDFFPLHGCSGWVFLEFSLNGCWNFWLWHVSIFIMSVAHSPLSCVMFYPFLIHFCAPISWWFSTGFLDMNVWLLIDLWPIFGGKQ